MFKNNFFRTTKNTAIAIAIVLGFSIGAKAEDTKNIETLQVSCNPFAVNNLDVGCNSELNLEPQAEKIAQTRRGRRRKSKVQGYYGGFSLGAMFPSGQASLVGEDSAVDIDFNTGFNGSVFGGINFSKNFAADLEFLLGFGSGDTDNFNQSFDDIADPLRELYDQTPGINFNGDLEAELDYSTFALYASPKFSLPVSEKFSVFVSPGIGLAQTNVNFKADSDLEITRTESTGDAQADAELDALATEFEGLSDELNADRDSSKTGISFQIKAGASYQISNTIGVFGQLRYVTLPTESNDEFETDNLNAFSTQGGLTFNF